MAQETAEQVRAKLNTVREALRNDGLDLFNPAHHARWSDLEDLLSLLDEQSQKLASQSRALEEAQRRRQRAENIVRDLADGTIDVGLLRSQAIIFAERWVEGVDGGIVDRSRAMVAGASAAAEVIHPNCVVAARAATERVCAQIQEAIAQHKRFDAHGAELTARLMAILTPLIARAEQAEAARERLREALTVIASRAAGCQLEPHAGNEPAPELVAVQEIYEWAHEALATPVRPTEEDKVLPTGTLIHVNGIPAFLGSDVAVETSDGNWQVICDTRRQRSTERS